MRILFVYPRFARHADANPELLSYVPMNEYLGSPSLGIACLAAVTPAHHQLELRDDRRAPADTPTDADLVALSFFTPAAERALELADYFRGQGKLVVAGGIFPTMMPDVVAPHVDAVVIGEGEASWLRLLADAEAGDLAPRYAAPSPVDLATLPTPKLSLYLEQETPGFEPDDYPVQISRGCPLDCQACVLPASMGKRIRELSLEQVLAQIDQLARRGKRACLTEDTSWLPGRGRRRLQELFTALAASGRRAAVSYIGISMPMILHTPTAVLAAAKQAGVDMFYLVGGFDPISTHAFTGRHPKATQQAHDAIRKATDLGIEPYTSFPLGGDGDDLGTVDRMLDFASRSGIRKAEFAIFTPYPGTPAWKRLRAEGRILTERWSRYHDASVVFRPAQMTPEELHEGYLRLWRDFYRDRSDLTALGRAERTIQF